jgi:hypothetical protein
VPTQAQWSKRLKPQKRHWSAALHIKTRLLAAGDAGEFFLEALAFGGVAGLGQAIGKLEEAIVLGLLGLQAGFDQIDQDATGSRVASFGQGADPLRNARGERDALPHGLV